MQRYIQMDEDGYWVTDGIRVADQDAGAELIRNLRYNPESWVATTQLQNQTAVVESADEPLVARQVEKQANGKWTLLAPYGVSFEFSLQTLSLDEWDRFHGLTQSGLPFVFSRKAQNEFFNLLDEFGDDWIEASGQRIEVPNYYTEHPEVGRAEFWRGHYQTDSTPWDLNAPHPALVSMLPKLKFSKSRVLVLGAGTGADAAHFASQGHLVTAVDFSTEAIEKAREKYKNLPNLKFHEMDLFSLPQEWNASFDIVFEHTCYAAISPQRRAELVRIWSRALNDHGHLLGVFFVMHRREGPPYGNSEWELHQRLKDRFRPLYWNRWHQSPPRRENKELFVYAQKHMK